MTMYSTHHLIDGVPALNRTYIREMAMTATELLNIDQNRRNVALVMGYSVAINNLEAIEAWIADFVLDYAFTADFINEILPSLFRHICTCRLDLAETVQISD